MMSIGIWMGSGEAKCCWPGLLQGAINAGFYPLSWENIGGMWKISLKRMDE